MFINDLFNKKQLNESLRDGEYVTFKVFFDDGTTETLNFSSDDIDWDRVGAKRNKKVVNVKRIGGIRSEPSSAPAKPHQWPDDSFARAQRAYDRQLPEAYDTSEGNREYFDTVQEWAQTVLEMGGEVIKARGVYVAHGWDGEMGEFDPATGEGWLVSKTYREGVAEGFSDIVKGVKRKMAGKEDPKDVQDRYARAARREIGDANKYNNPAANRDSDQAVNRYNKVAKVVNKKGVAEAGPFSYGAKKPRKGSVADLAARKRKEQEKDRQPVEPRDHMVGVARVVKEYGDTARGQKQLTRVHKRAVGRIARADDKNMLEPDYTKRDLKTVRKNQATANRAWDRMTDLDLDEASVYKKDQDLSSIPTQELEAFVRKHWGGGVPTMGQGESVKRAMRELRRRQKQGVAEGISVVDQDYDLDQMILTLDIEGKKVSFTYWDYDENFANAERRDVFDQLQEQPWYARLDHPTRMEILDAAYRAIRGLEPQEYRPTVRDEPLDEQGVAEGSVQDKLYKRHQELRKKRGAPNPEYYKELKTTFDLPDDERWARTAELKKKYNVKESTVTNEDRERYLDEMRCAGYEIVTKTATLCPECGGAAYADRMLAEKQDACYHKVKSRYKVWPSAYASGALVRCRKVGAKNWGNKSKK